MVKSLFRRSGIQRFVILEFFEAAVNTKGYMALVFNQGLRFSMSYDLVFNAQLKRRRYKALCVL